MHGCRSKRCSSTQNPSSRRTGCRCWRTSLDAREAIAVVVSGKTLSKAEAESAMGTVMAGEATPAQLGALLAALSMRGETPDEIAGFASALRANALHVVVDDGAIDVVGTGGDRSNSINISTIAALVVAGAGGRVAKHGNRAASSQCGSADVLEALGVVIDLPPAGVARCLDDAGIGFCFAQKFHPALRFAGPVRKELGVPTTFNFLGPLANPAGVARQSVGVSDPAMAERIIGALAALGKTRALVYYGHDGLDELTTTTTSTVFELVEGEIRSF